MTGWECPRCHACYAPHVQRCEACQPQSFTLSTVCGGCGMSPCAGTGTACRFLQFREPWPPFPFTTLSGMHYQ